MLDIYMHIFLAKKKKKRKNQRNSIRNTNKFEIITTFLYTNSKLYIIDDFSSFVILKRENQNARKHTFLCIKKIFSSTFICEDLVCLHSHHIPQKLVVSYLEYPNAWEIRP